MAPSEWWILKGTNRETYWRMGLKCWTCGGEGHMSSDCEIKGASKRPSKPNTIITTNNLVPHRSDETAGGRQQQGDESIGKVQAEFNSWTTSSIHKLNTSVEELGKDITDIKTDQVSSSNKLDAILALISGGTKVKKGTGTPGTPKRARRDREEGGEEDSETENQSDEEQGGGRGRTTRNTTKGTKKAKGEVA